MKLLSKDNTIEWIKNFHPLIYTSPRNFLTLESAGSMYGTFELVTLKGDFTIEAELSTDGDSQALLSGGVGVNGLELYMNATGNLQVLYEGVQVGSDSVSSYNDLKLYNLILERSGFDITLTVDDVEVVTGVLVGDCVLDTYARRSADAQYMDGILANVVIKDTDEVSPRDVLTLDAAGSMYATAPAWEPASGSDLVFEFVTDAVITTSALHFIDSRLEGSNGGNIYVATNLTIAASGAGSCAWASAVIKVDGVTSSVYPNDGNIHRITVGLTQTGSTPNSVFIGARHTVAQFIDGSILDVKLHDLTTPSNSRRYRFDTESETTVPNYYNPGTGDLTLNNITLSEWESMTRDEATGSLVGPVNTILDDNYTPPADILWPIKSGLGYELNKRKSIGPELWSNPTIGAEWTDNGDGSYTLDGPGAFSGLTITDPVPSKSYRVSFDHANFTASLTLRLDGATKQGGIIGTGSKSYVVTANDAGGTEIGFYRETNSIPISGVLSNISVREVQQPLTYVNTTSNEWEKFRKKGRDWVNAAYPNLLSWSEDFGNAAWVAGTNAAVASNVEISPVGTMTADRLTSDTNLAGQRKEQTVTVMPSQVKTYSVYIKAGTQGGERARLIASGSASYTLNITPTNNWQRFSLTIPVTDTAASLICRVYPSDVGGAPGDNIVVWGAQLNEGSTALPYKKTTDITSRILEAP